MKVQQLKMFFNKVIKEFEIEKLSNEIKEYEGICNRELLDYFEALLFLEINILNDKTYNQEQIEKLKQLEIYRRVVKYNIYGYIKTYIEKMDKKLKITKFEENLSQYSVTYKGQELIEVFFENNKVKETMIELNYIKENIEKRKNAVDIILYELESELDEIVKNSLNNFIDLVCNVQDRVDEVLSYSKIDYNEELKKLKLMEIEKKIKRVEVMLEELVKDYKCDIISEDDYDSFKQKYLMEKNSLNLEKEELNKAKINSYNLNWINNFKKLEHIETIDRNIVDSLIENIFVNDDKTVEIQFKFKNHYEDALRYLKMQDNVTF